jgi:hypothetical protein
VPDIAITEKGMRSVGEYRCLLVSSYVLQNAVIGSIISRRPAPA